MSFNLSNFSANVHSKSGFLRKTLFRFRCDQIPDLSFVIHSIKINDKFLHMKAYEFEDFSTLRDLKTLKENKFDFFIEVFGRDNKVVHTIFVKPNDITWSLHLDWKEIDEIGGWEVLVTK